MEIAEIALDVCTPEGKTWLARVTGIGGRYGIERSFVHAASSSLSKSGRTGTMTYLVGNGLYESNEGRRRYGRRYWGVKDGEVTQLTLSELKARF